MRNARIITGDLPLTRLAHLVIVIVSDLFPSNALTKLESVNVTRTMLEKSVILAKPVMETSKKDVRNVTVMKLDPLETIAIRSVGSAIAKPESTENSATCVFSAITTLPIKVVLSVTAMITDLSIRNVVTLLENAYVDRMWKALVVTTAFLASST